MILIYGTRLYGRIDACNESHLATRFFHVAFLPLIPLATVLVVTPGRLDGRPEFLAARWSRRSIAAALLRTWGVLGAAIVVCVAVGWFADALENRNHALLLGLPVLVFGVCAAMSIAFGSLGRLEPEERARRRRYARFVGVAVDPGVLAGPHDELRRRVEMALLERAGALGLLGYRNEAPPGDLAELALAPAVHDEDLLESALTLSRLDMLAARGPARRAAARRHAAIWRRLRNPGAERRAA